MEWERKRKWERSRGWKVEAREWDGRKEKRRENAKCWYIKGTEERMGVEKAH